MTKQKKPLSHDLAECKESLCSNPAFIHNDDAINSFTFMCVCVCDSGCAEAYLWFVSVAPDRCDLITAFLTSDLGMKTNRL